MNQEMKQSTDVDFAPTSGVSTAPDHVRQTRELLEQHPHFRGHSGEIDIELHDDAMILHGRLPSFYLKQQLQEVVRCIAGKRRIENRVVVVSVDGVSSTADRT